MAFRGFISLNGAEIANSSRVVSHLGKAVPTNDLGFFIDPYDGVLVEDGLGYVPPDMPDVDGLYPLLNSSDTDGLYPIPKPPCALTPSTEFPYLYELTPDMEMVAEGLYTPPNGAKRFGPGILILDGMCWGPQTPCNGCEELIAYDDSWPELRQFLRDTEYRIELAPWYVHEIPESSEFLGVWIQKLDGLGTAPVNRPITQLAGSGAVAGPHRDGPQTITVEALLLGCTSAGVEYGKEWLTCLLRDTTDNVTSVLQYLSATPAYSTADPESLAREVHGVVLTREPAIISSSNLGKNRPHQQGTMYRISWEMVALNPYSYMPAVVTPVVWDEITRQPINWIHAADCSKPETCEDMPVMFSADCVPEEIPVINTPPPVCGGCMPVGAMDMYSFRVPTMDRPFRCRETAVSMRIRNLGAGPLTIQGFWRICGTDIRCEDDLWPLQIAGLPAGTEVVLDGISEKFWSIYDNRVYRPVGIVGTPRGAPWRPPIIDRQECYDFIVQAPGSAEFDIVFTLADRTA